MSARPAPRAQEQPGRSCPLSYRYSPRVFDRSPEIEATALYVVGGLYGNLEALEALQRLAMHEPQAALVFNGDFHWFDATATDFRRVNEAVLRHAALRGNVETELASEDSGAGCGCAYPLDVADAEVLRSNRILEELRESARGDAQARTRLGMLPMHLVARVGAARVGIVHGDATSLAGWGFAASRLDEPQHRRWIDSVFDDARVDVFASSHTCLPALRRFGDRVVANNGAAGMPNFGGTRYGVVTRIGIAPARAVERLYGVRVAGVFVDALRLDYDDVRWRERFLARWPEGSPAHDSYFRRMVEGPRFQLAQAAGVTAA